MAKGLAIRPSSHVHPGHWGNAQTYTIISAFRAEIMPRILRTGNEHRCKYAEMTASTLLRATV